MYIKVFTTIVVIISITFLSYELIKEERFISADNFLKNPEMYLGKEISVIGNLSEFYTNGSSFVAVIHGSNGKIIVEFKENLPKNVVVNSEVAVTGEVVEIEKSENYTIVRMKGYNLLVKCPSSYYVSGEG